MSSYDKVRITPLSFIPRLPSIIFNGYTAIRGLLMARQSREDVPLGLGLMVEAAAAKNPDGIAVYYEETQINYRDFNAWANRIADYYSSKGYKKGDVAIVFIENRPELLVVVAALAKLGIISSMVNTSQTGKVFEHSVNLVQPSLAIIGEELVDVFETSFDQLELGRENCYYVADNALNIIGEAPQAYNNLILEAKTANQHNPQSSKNIFLHDPVFYIYTSGTTGMPKATVFTHGRFMRSVGAFGLVCMRQTKNDVMYVPLPFYHSTAMSVCWGGVLQGAAAVVMRKRFSVTSFWDDCRKYNATGFGYVGELCRYLFDQPHSPKDKDHKVYKVIGNGLRPSIWREFKERFGIERVHEFYASSEGNIVFVNAFNFDQTVGYTTVNFALVKYDIDSCLPIRDKDGFLIKVEDGEPGLLIGEITPNYTYDGYTDPEKTEKTIVRDAFVKGDKWFNSSDVMRSIGCKHAQFVDRLGDTFRWKGENVATNEVESLIHDFGGIEDCVVYGVEIPNTNGRAGMATLTLNVDEKDFDFSGLFQYAKKNMPSYAIPLFLRIRKALVDTTGSFKYKKASLKEEAYYQQKCNDDSLYVLLPGESNYKQLDQQLCAAIDAGEYRF